MGEMGASTASLALMACFRPLRELMCDLSPAYACMQMLMFEDTQLTPTGANSQAQLQPGFEGAVPP